MALHDLLREEMEARDREREKEIKKWEEEDKKFYKENYDENGPLIETEVKITWIPMSKELPPDSKPVLFKVKGCDKFEVGTYKKDSDKVLFTHFYTYMSKEDVTHWAKINFPKRKYY